MDTNELMGELLQALTDEVRMVKTKVEQLPTQVPTDYRDSIRELAQAVLALQKAARPAPPAVDLSAITTQLERLEHSSRQRPEYRLSRYMQYGAYAFGVMVILLAVSVWYALSWRFERDQYAQAYQQDNWRVRYTKQANADFYAYMEGMFAKEAPKVQQWTLEQEQADQKRELARRAAEQAKAMDAQADELEGKAPTKGKKKESR